MLTVQLPYSEAAYRRLRAAKRRRSIGWWLVAAAVIVGVFGSATFTWPGPTPVVVVAAVVTAAWGLVGVARSWRDVRRLTVGVELDASRRWVTLRSVHPRFVAAVDPTETLQDVS